MFPFCLASLHSLHLEAFSGVPRFNGRGQYCLQLSDPETSLRAWRQRVRSTQDFLCDMDSAKGRGSFGSLQNTAKQLQAAYVYCNI